jgi:SAM-dependent methyltransferase
VIDMEPWGERSAELYELIFAADDHEAQVAYVNGVIEDRAPLARSLLDVACGTGWHLELFARRYPHVEGLDLSLAMLNRARERVPRVPLHQADMRVFEIGRTFDAVTCLSSSIVSMPDADALQEAIGTMARHLRPGGVLVLEP